jgi:hypothetical protein
LTEPLPMKSEWQTLTPQVRDRALVSAVCEHVPIIRFPPWSMRLTRHSRAAAFAADRAAIGPTGVLLANPVHAHFAITREAGSQQTAAGEKQSR